MAAKKSSDAAVQTALSVQEEIAQVLGDDMPEGDSNDQKFLKQIITLFADKKKVSDADWEDLSDTTKDWVGDAADAFKSKDALPPFPGAEEEVQETETEAEEEVKKGVKKGKKASKKEEETEQQEEASEAASDETSSEDLDGDVTETQGKESEVAANKKRGTKAAKSAKANGSKPQKRAAAAPAPEAKSAKKEAGKAAGKAKTNGHGNGLKTVTKLVWQNPKASLESVTAKAKAAGLKTSDTQIRTLYHIAQVNVDMAKEVGKIEA